ncbi:bifunctional serine/threonine-protein kinase/ABC transporter substrate-binding protein [Trichocoleus desertorum AS-A10]|uniref:bifunctional serine/threonine-protein kinase/ABC transporter substrate-binding protein n=1 Tax=Trichocoleus desertorum TaxID=1481672 RepID=UPI0032969DD2
MNAMLGRLLGARYKVIQALGSGGFGQTFIAEDMQRPGNPPCVLKHLNFATQHPHVLQQVRRLFYAEAETLEKLGRHHDQIPQLLAYFEEAEEFYLVQEFVPGNPLSVELPWGTKLSEAQVIGILEDVLGVLAYIHSQGVIHRDIKPDNLIRRQHDGKLVLIDFGAVKTITNQVAETIGQTQLSVPIYTSGYGASEQCLGKPQFSSDIYALGVIAVQALTGMRPSQFPVDPESGEIVWRDQARVSVQLATIIDKMVRYHFNQRYQSATTVLQALQHITDLPRADPVEPIIPAIATLENPPDRRLRHLRSVLLGLGVATIASFGMAILLRKPLPQLFSDVTVETSTPTPSPATAIATDYISWGEKILTPGTSQPAKQKGVDALAIKAYPQAEKALEVARQAERSDPETLIYLNNARIGATPAHAIAVVVPLGDTLNSSLEILRGVAQAQTQVNQGGGINGVPLKVAIANDNNQIETAQAIATDLINHPHVLGVVGHGTSDTTLAAGKVYQTGQLAIVAPISSAVQLSTLGSYIFRVMPSDRFTARALCNYMLTRLQKKRVAIFFSSNSSYSESLSSEFKNALFYGAPGKVVAEFDLAGPDFNAYESVEKAIQQKAEVIMLAAPSQVSDRALQVVQINRRRLPVLAGDSIYTKKTLQVGGEAAVGMVVAVPSNVLGNTRLPFQQQAQKLWGHEIDWRTALAYDSTQTLVAGIRRDPSRRGVRQTLETPNFTATGALGAVSFSSTGDREGVVQLVQVTPVAKKQSQAYQFKPIN